MNWNTKLTVIGPCRSPVDKLTVAANDPSILWRATVNVTDKATPGSPEWRHLFLQLEPWVTKGKFLNLPGLAIVRAEVTQIVVNLFEKAFTFGSAGQVATLLVQLLPNDDQGPAQWDINPGGTAVAKTPLLMCVAGAIPVADKLGAWCETFKGWGKLIPESLQVHSSGLSFFGAPEFVWVTSGKLARYNVLLPRPTDGGSPAAGLPILIEPDRQWLISDFDDGSVQAPEAIRELRDNFRLLDRILRRGRAVDQSPEWVQLALQNPSGPPRFDWLVSKPGVSKFRLRPGETVVTLTDQHLGRKDVIPRSLATINGDVSLVSISKKKDAFRVDLGGTRELAVPMQQPAAALLEKWVGLVIYEPPNSTIAGVGQTAFGRFRWLPGRALNKTQAADLRKDFAGGAIESLILAATINVASEGATFVFHPELRVQTDLRDGRLYWFGAGFHELESGSLQELPAYQQLRKAAQNEQDPVKKRVLTKLYRAVSSLVNYENDQAEAFNWQEIETTYEVNQVATFLRNVHGIRRPDPDEILSGGSGGEYQVTPPILWGTMPLESGWAMLPFWNTTEELYLRLLTPEQPETEVALVNGVASWGNDDPRLWFDEVTDTADEAYLGDQQRWSMTLLDADEIRGSWQYKKVSAAPDSWWLQKSRLCLYQPEVVFQGMLWLARGGPTNEDSLPELKSWPNAVQDFALRSLRTRESYPSPYVVRLPQGKMTRIAAAQPLHAYSYARLEDWKWMIECNEHLVTIPNLIPEAEAAVLLTLPTSVPSIPERTERLSMRRRIRWPANKEVTPEARNRLDFYLQQADYARDFLRAVKLLKGRLPQVGGQSESDLIEEFVYTDGSQPQDSGPNYARLETVLHWEGGELDEQSRNLLSKWEAMEGFKVLVRELRRKVDLPTSKELRIFDAMASSDLWNHGFTAHSLLKPLVWRRHPKLPFVQALPLTQSLNPANYPSSSRQLAPFELNYAQAPSGSQPPLPPVPVDWIFGSSDPSVGNAARQFGEYLRLDRGQFGIGLPEPALEWTEAKPLGTRFLAMASLSLPGVSAHPCKPGVIAPLSDPSWEAMALQWSHGLPYLDEQYATAQLPREVDGDNAADPSISNLPAPLQRETFARGWGELAERAFLAAADADHGLLWVAANKQTMPSLIEPFQWEVNTTLSSAEFPGTLSFSDRNVGSIPLELSEPLSHSIVVGPAQHTALRGVQGAFELTQANGTVIRHVTADLANKEQFDVIAGSMRAQISEGRLRDQRGLQRGVTEVKSALWLLTQLGGSADKTVYWTSRRAIPLDLGGFGEWSLAVKDLPVVDGRFDRAKARSPQNEDVNDPAAEGATENFRQGYEWRLGGRSLVPQLYIGPFPFLPQTLQSVSTDAAGVTSVEMTGRLQLPLPGDERQVRERADESNIVQLRFDRDGQSLKLKDISMVQGDNLFGAEPRELVWPLHDTPGAPTLRVKTLKLMGDELHLSDASIDFTLYGVPWTPRVTKPSPLKVTALETKSPLELDVKPPGKEVAIASATAVLDWKTGKHQLVVELQADWGDQALPHVRATKKLQLLPEANVETDGAFVAAGIPGGLKLKKTNDSKLNPEQELLNPVVQLTWSGFAPPQNNLQDGIAVYLLPGFGVPAKSCEDSSPGYASMEFTVTRNNADDPTKPPKFERMVGASEFVFNCEWAKPLQEFDPSESKWASTRRAFNSSAGSISLGILVKVETDSGQNTSSSMSLLLNGMIEVKNLTSWPVPTPGECEPWNEVATLPVGDQDLSHWRHTARILLNQVHMPQEFLQPNVEKVEKEPPTLFSVTKVFQFLSVVEHQIAELKVSPLAEGKPVTVDGLPREFRFTATQEVRFAAPDTLAKFWEMFRTKTKQRLTLESARDQNGSLVPLRGVVSGWVREKLLDLMLTGGDDSLSRLGKDSLVVELSAAFFLPRTRSQSLLDEGNFANVQVLPGEIDQAIPSSLEDLVPPTSVAGQLRDKRDPNPWSLVVLPFVGKIQPQNRDGLPIAEGNIEFAATATLRIDPLLWWTKPAKERPKYLSDLTSRVAGKGRAIFLSSFDLVESQKWAELDPVSLETGLYRILSPLPATFGDGPIGFDGILATTPAGGLGRLSRPLALRQAFNPELHSYPPQVAANDREDPIDWEWRYGALLVLHQRITKITPDKPDLDLGFFAVGKRLAQILVGKDAPSGLNRLPAVTLLPPPMTKDDEDLGQPLSLTPSPYLAIRRLPLPPDSGDSQLRIVIADVVVSSQHNVGSKVTPEVIASRIWQERYQEVDGKSSPASMPGAAEVLAWAEDARRGLANDSLVAVIRVRSIRGIAGSGAPSIKFEFFALPRASSIPLIPPQAKPLRAELGVLRAREGQFGGPIDVVEFSEITLAPPQVRDVEPFHFESPPIHVPKKKEDVEVLSWEWGFSGIQYSIRHAANGTGQVLGPIGAKEWCEAAWISASHPVQFFEQPIPGTTTLPKNFRAAAIRSLLPAPPRVPCPSSEELMAATALPSGSELKESWYSVLPGEHRMLLVGGRPGVYAITRPHLLTQIEADFHQFDFGGTWKAEDKIVVSFGGIEQEIKVATTDIKEICDSVLVRLAKAFPKLLVTRVDKSLQVVVKPWPQDLTIPDFPTLLIKSQSAAGTIDASMRSSRNLTSSGSVPIQHRWPRPVHFPPNRRALDAIGTAQKAALVPWGNWFDLDASTEIKGTAAGGSQVEIHLSGPSNDLSISVATDAQGNWHASPTWRELPQGQVTISVRGTGAPILTTAASVANYVDRSVDARRNPHDFLLLMEGDKAHGLDVELLPLVLGEPAELSDRWPTFKVTLRLTAFPQNDIAIWKKLEADKLKLSLCSSTIAIPLACTDERPLPERRFKVEPENLEALKDLIARAAHGELLRFELQVDVEKTGAIQGPPLIATLPLRRVHSNVVPLPFAPMFCVFEDPEYSRRLASPTSRETTAIRLTNSTNTEPVTLALDRQEYNPSTTFFMTIGLAKHASPFDLKIARIDSKGLKEEIFNSRDAAINANLPPNQVIDVRFSASRNSLTNTTVRVGRVLAPGDRVEFQISANKVAGVFEDKPIIVAVQIVRDPVTPPPEAGYALLRRLVEKQALATAEINEGKVSGIHVSVGGKKFLSQNPPKVVIDPPGGSGGTIAKATVTGAKIDVKTGALAVDAVDVSDGGTGYLTAPIVRIGDFALPSVECVRFAWSPTASRVEFVDPGDLLRDSVRRRAVFVWQDTIRPGSTPLYGMQKISPQGSTLIPSLFLSSPEGKNA